MTFSYQSDFRGYQYKESIYHEENEISKVYYHSGKEQYLIIDNPSVFTADFSYHHYCLSQNRFMNQSRGVLRFLSNDSDIDSQLSEFPGESKPIYFSSNFDRSIISIDPSPLEYLFEECFTEAFGEDSVKYLAREYPIITNSGRTGFIDYALFHKNGFWIAIEENGVSYHHPKLIGNYRYKKNLDKQNSVISQGGRLYRWDTRSFSNRVVLIDEIKNYLGDISQYLIQTSITTNRRISLYRHQTEYLSDLENDRKIGKTAALVLLPTGTGKTKIACEDMLQVRSFTGSFKGLVLVPTLDLVRQWKDDLNTYGRHLKDVVVKTYTGAARDYQNDDPMIFNYIVFDEAHHAVAPVCKRIIEHYQPEFLLGLTATDQRLDEKKLEDVFSSYRKKIDLKEAIEQDLLCPIRAFRLKSNIDLSTVRFNRNDYIHADLERKITVGSRNQLVVECIYEFFGEKLPGKQGVVFCINVNHAKEMARLLQKKGFEAESVDGKDSKRSQKINNYLEGKIQFLCTCSLLTEGWDAPDTSVLVMARPTLSKVLYMQQLGRGTRKAKGKEFLYVIDVVDSYGSFGRVKNTPWSAHALFESSNYLPWGLIVGSLPSDGKEMINIDTTHETLIKLDPIDIFTWQKEYEDHLSIEQMARELFVSTGTVNSWLKKGDIEADITIPVGRSSISLFAPEKVKKIREQKGLKEHSDETIIEDFHEFIEKGTYTFSFKMVFILSFLEVMDEDGEADFFKLMNSYRDFYLKRHAENQTIDRVSCPYTDETYLKDDNKMKSSILRNPFEKFERKRFMNYSKDLSCISFHHRLRSYFLVEKNETWLREKLLTDLENYYRELK